MLAHRLRRWASIKTALVQRHVFVRVGCCSVYDAKFDIHSVSGLVHSMRSPRETTDVDPIMVYFLASVADGRPTLNQHWVKVVYRTVTQSPTIALLTYITIMIKCQNTVITPLTASYRTLIFTHFKLCLALLTYIAK